jgi:hypothetical protein
LNERSFKNSWPIPDLLNEYSFNKSRREVASERASERRERRWNQLSNRVARCGEDGLRAGPIAARRRGDGGHPPDLLNERSFKNSCRLRPDLIE